REGSYSGSSCGNGTTEYDASTFAGEECDGEEGCTDECVWAGSSIAYTTPSICGDGVIGAGEIAACENGSSGDGFIDDTQVSEVTADASYEVSETTGLAAATIEVSTSGLSVSADLTLMCVAENDQDCSDPTTHGVGDANCCYERPETVTLVPTTGDACLNATVYATFTQEMDTSSFTATETSGSTTVERAQMYAKLNLASGQSCPATHTTIAQAPSSIALRIWNAVKGFFVGQNVSADQGDCILPIQSYSQTAQDDGTYKVAIRATELMEANSSYTLVIEGDDDVTDESSVGVRSLRDVGMNGTVTQTFTTGSTVCTLDALSITDGDDDSPYYFSSTGETHEYSVDAISYSTGSAQEISPISGSYDWTYSDWSVSDATILSAAAISASLPDEAAVEALGVNGDVTVGITATVTTGGTESVSGTANVTAYLCENPWPSVASYPWSDDATGLANGLATAGRNGFMNFSTGYCRDVGDDGESDDLSSVSVIQPPTWNATNVVKEYLFELGDGSGDAIGVRIVRNASYLSPMAWYEAQGFIGSPSETTIDGFPAVQDGRTVYVSAPNVSSSSIYPNIYVISYNEGASQETIDIYNMMLENMSFAINVDDNRYCYESGAIVVGADGDAKTCSSDLECDVSGSEECGSDKLKLMRDIERLGELNDIALTIDEYSDDNGTCSDTTSQSCTEDSDCPDDETCEPIVPTLPSGTYVASLASSAWGSWSEIFGGALNDSGLATDPLNDYSYCGVTSSLFASYDGATCVNQSTGAYACPEDSYAYHYRAIGSRGYELAAALEYDGTSWAGDFDADATDDYLIQAGVSGTAESMCDGDVYGTSTLCGDGVVGGTEYCEIGDTSGSECDVDATVDSDSDGDATNDEDGTINQVCKSDCSDYEDVSGATCEAGDCGDGVVSGSEQCDDGTYNGQYGYCGTSCTYASGSYCGDGEVSGSEACDCGDGTATSDGRPYGGVVGDCIGTNGEYGGNENTTCAWDCSGPASYCGDAEVDEEYGEVCDGEAGTWSGKLCVADPASSSGPSVNSYATCEDDSDCPADQVCGDGVDNGSLADACPISTVCTAGDIGAICDEDSDCDSTTGSGDGVCSNQEYATTRTIACEDDGSSGETCTYATTWGSTECKATGSCGDGAVDAGEACDDGNTDNTDSCSNECTANVCGDGYLYEGEEQCDEGTGNGGGCEASYGSSCSACSVSCPYESSSGNFCGDGEMNGDEFCDGNDMPYYYISTSLFSSGVDEDAELNGSCTPGSSAIVDDSDTPSDSSDDILYICSNVGMCSGGADNGDYCTANSDCDASDCVFPTCDADCTSSCPFTTENASLELTTNQAGARASSSALLYSFSTDSDADLPNASTLTIPSCSAATELLADVSYDGVTQPEAYVVFVTDVSGSMSSTLGSSTRMEVAKASIIEAIESLYDELDSVQIALVKYSSSVATYSDDAGTTDTSDDITWFGPEYQADLETAVTAYSYGGGTYTDSGLEAAEELLDGIEPTTTNYRKVIVHLSDGEPSTSHDPTQDAYSILFDDTSTTANDAYELYSIALTSEEDLITSMNVWSSNTTVSAYSSTSSSANTGEYNEINYLDYSYSGSTTEELQDAYQEIINSIVFGTAIMVSTDDQGTTDSSDDVTYMTRGVLEEGSNIPLPWPEGFTCSTTGETELPLQITFAGVGQIEISSPSINYCAP
ncbi:MAG: Multiple EGF-like-domain protein 3, partial [Candidatus Uhrbacteria bacterium GW2011_GWD2_52_7]